MLLNASLVILQLVVRSLENEPRLDSKDGVKSCKYGETVKDPALSASMCQGK